MLQNPLEMGHTRALVSLAAVAPFAQNRQPRYMGGEGVTAAVWWRVRHRFNPRLWSGMSQFEWFDEVPSLDEAPDECQYRGCSDPATHFLTYSNPIEYVCYCREHVVEMSDERDYPRASARLTR